MKVCYDLTPQGTRVTDCPPGTVQYGGPWEKLPLNEEVSLHWIKVEAKRVAPCMVTLPLRFVRPYIKEAVKTLRRKTGTLVVTMEQPFRTSPGGQTLAHFGLWHVKKGSGSGFEDIAWPPPDEIRKLAPQRV